METKPFKSCPRFICVENPLVKEQIVTKDPKLMDLISDTFTDDTAIVVLTSRSEMRRVETIERKDRGVIYVDQDGFRTVMRRIWTFVDSYQRGTSIKKSVTMLVNLLEEGKPQ